MIDVAIVGAGGFGREVNLILQQLIKAGKNYNFIGYYDDADKSHELGANYLGTIADLNTCASSLSVLVAVGNGTTRKLIVDRIDNRKVNFLSLVSPYAIFNDLQDVGEGSIICAGANLTTNITIAKFVVINLNATVGHDCIIHDYASIMPGVNLAGNVTIGKQAFVGSGANVLNGLKIGENAKLGAGAVLTKDVAANKTAVGVPANEV